MRRPPVERPCAGAVALTKAAVPPGRSEGRAVAQPRSRLRRATLRCTYVQGADKAKCEANPASVRFVDFMQATTKEFVSHNAGSSGTGCEGHTTPAYLCAAPEQLLKYVTDVTQHVESACLGAAALAHAA